MPSSILLVLQPYVVRVRLGIPVYSLEPYIRGLGVGVSIYSVVLHPKIGERENIGDLLTRKETSDDLVRYIVSI